MQALLSTLSAAIPSTILDTTTNHGLAQQPRDNMTSYQWFWCSTEDQKLNWCLSIATLHGCALLNFYVHSIKQRAFFLLLLDLYFGIKKRWNEKYTSVDVRRYVLAQVNSALISLEHHSCILLVAYWEPWLALNQTVLFNDKTVIVWSWWWVAVLLSTQTCTGNRVSTGGGEKHA